MVHRFFIFSMAGVVFLTGFFFVLQNWQTYANKIIEVSSSALHTLPKHEHRSEDEVYDHSITINSTFIVPEDLWLVGSSAKVRNAPVSVLHHAILSVYGGERDRGCFPREIDSTGTFFVNLTKRYPDGYGIFLPKNTVLLLQTMFHNSTAETYRDVSASLSLDVLYAKNVSPGMREVRIYIVWTRDEVCKEYFIVPPKSIDYTKTTEAQFSDSYLVFPEDGEIIMFRPHMHVERGGKSMTVFLNGKKILEIRPIKQDNNELTIPFLRGEPAIFSIKRGDRMAISVTYDNPAETPITDAMGLLRVYFSPAVKLKPL